MKDTGVRGYISGEVTKDGLEIEFVPFAKRNYKHLIIEIDSDATLLDLKHKVSETVERHGSEHIYKFTIKGKRNPVFEIIFEDLASTCNLAEIVDKTIPDYDFEQIYNENKDNILGMFVDRYINSGESLDTIRERALQYGTRALLDSMEEK